MLDLTNALKRGIHPERPGINQTQGLYGLKGMRPSNEGLIPFRALTQITGSDVWPLCSAHRLIGEDVLYHENGVSNTDGLIGYEGSRHGIPHIADFYTFWLATDGYTTHIRRSMDDEDIYRYTAPQIQTCCARKESRLILGGFDNAFGYVDWTAILAAYNSAETVGEPGINWVWGSSSGAADWMMFFDDELNGDWQYWTYHWRQRVEFYADLWKRNQMFMRPMPWRGYVWNVKPLGDVVMVYGQDGVAALTFHDSGIVGMKPIQRYPDRLGLMGRDTVAGTDDVHVMQSSDGDLWQITPDLVAQKLKYKWVLPTEGEGTRSAMSYEPLEQEFYLSNAAEAVVEEDDVVYTGFVRYVNCDNTGTKNGLTWATGYDKIQDAIDDVDTNRGANMGYVLVKSGTYTDSRVDWQVITAKENIYVMGGYSGVGMYKSGITVVDAQSVRRCVGALSLDGFIFFSGITFVNGVMRSTSAGGFATPVDSMFAIQDVNGVYFVNCTVADMGENQTSQNVFYVYQSASGYSNAPVLFLNCTFDTNTIATGSGQAGVICYDSYKAGNCTVESCTFTNSMARASGLVWVNSRDDLLAIGLRVYNCEFDTCDVNYCDAALVYGTSDTNVIMRGCYAHENKGHLIRGIYDGEFYIYQSEFANNTDDAYFMHVGTNAGYDPFTIDGCYIHGNNAGGGNGILGSWAGWRQITIKNTIMSGNTPHSIWLNDALNTVGAIVIDNCHITGTNLIQTASSGTHAATLTATRSYISGLSARPYTAASVFSFTECYIPGMTTRYEISTHGMINFVDCTGTIEYYTGAGANPAYNWTGWSGGAPVKATFTYTGEGHVTHIGDTDNSDEPPVPDPRFYSSTYSEIDESDVGPYPEEAETDTGGLCVVINDPIMAGRWRRLGTSTWHYSVVSGELYIESGLAAALYTIEFEDVTGGWNKPMRIRAMVRPGRTTFVYVSYPVNKTGTPPESATTYMLNQNGLCQHYQSPIGFIGTQFCGIEEAL